jgi:hypothetical protein
VPKVQAGCDPPFATWNGGELSQADDRSDRVNTDEDFAVLIFDK